MIRAILTKMYNTVFDDSRDALIRTRRQIDRSWLCLSVICMAIPVWFCAFIELATHGESIDNPAGIGIHFANCVILGLLLAPLFSWLVLPILVRRIGHPIGRAVILTFCFSIVGIAINVYGQHINAVAQATGDSVSLIWCLVWYNCVFLAPPIYLGVLVGCIMPQRKIPLAASADEELAKGECRRSIEDDYDQQAK